MKGKTCAACQGLNLDKFIQPIILAILSRQEAMNGFQVVKAMEHYVTFKNCTPDPSGVYRYLKAMKTRGLLMQKEDQEGRALYSITEEGADCLKSWKDTILSYAKDLEVLTEQLGD